MADPTPDYYRILGISRSASRAELRKAYHRLARQYHPDVSQAPNAEAVFQRINEAYQVLSDRRRRAEYDDLTHRWQNRGRMAYQDFSAIDQFVANYFDEKGNIQREYACLFNCPHCGSEATVFFDQTIISWENYVKRCDVCSQSISIDYRIKKDKIVFFEAKIQQ